MKTFLCFILLVTIGEAQTLQLPARSSSAPTGSQFFSLVSSLSRQAREDTIFNHVAAGNIPDFLRMLVPVSTSEVINGTSYTLEYFVTPDYLAIGTDSNYFLMPMTPILAQKIANKLNCTLPTAKMVDQIYSAAKVKLRPQPIPPDADMDKVPRFKQHDDSVKALRNPLLSQYPLGTLVGGTKKDVIIDKKIYSWLKSSVPKPVVIYGWHQLNGVPIQPTYNGHGETYADYSHGIRLVQRMAKINGAEISLIDITKDPVYFILVNDTALVKPYYGSLTSVDDEASVIPRTNELYQNFPNPFTPLDNFVRPVGGRGVFLSNGVNPTTHFKFSITDFGSVKLTVFDTLGKEVAEVVNEELSPGEYEFRFSNKDAQLSSGVYFYRLQTATFSQTQKMVLLQ